MPGQHHFRSFKPLKGLSLPHTSAQPLHGGYVTAGQIHRARPHADRRVIYTERCYGGKLCAGKPGKRPLSFFRFNSCLPDPCLTFVKPWPSPSSPGARWSCAVASRDDRVAEATEASHFGFLNPYLWSKRLSGHTDLHIRQRATVAMHIQLAEHTMRHRQTRGVCKTHHGSVGCVSASCVVTDQPICA